MSGGAALVMALLAGGAFAAGILCLLSLLPAWRTAPLAIRIAPYVRDVVPDAALPAGVRPVLGLLPGGRPLREQMIVLTDRMLGGSAVLSRRLAQAGLDTTTATAFRSRQLGWLVGGLIVGACAIIMLALVGRMSPPVVVLPALTALGAAVACDMRLTARVRSRRSRLADELPTTLEFLALCLSAGEGFPDALRRVAAIGSGELTAELRRVVVAVGTGSPLVEALTEMASRLQLPALSRAVDQIVAALERGAPLAAVLQAQAGDAREEAKRLLIEQAGRKEILMLLPLVFLILPLSVLFAIFPGLFILRLGIG